MIDKIKGCLVGGAVGDALGFPIEFRKNVKEKEFTKFNTFGLISDDTQMTLFTAVALLNMATRFNLRGVADDCESHFYYAYLDWADMQKNQLLNVRHTWLKGVKKLQVSRGPGQTCLSALASNKMGTITKPINDSKGCGGVMRVAPIGLYVLDPTKAGIFAAKSAAITHGHQLGIIPAFVQAVLINILLHSNLSILEALNKAMQILNKNKKMFKGKFVSAFKKIVKKAINLSTKNIGDTQAIASLGEGWVAEEAFAIAIYSCLKYSNSFEDCVVCAVNHDGDSDSTGSIAGNIIGTFLGFDQIPKHYVDNLELIDVITEVAEDLSISCPVSEYSDNNDEFWISKYLKFYRDPSLKQSK